MKTLSFALLMFISVMVFSTPAHSQGDKCVENRYCTFFRVLGRCTSNVVKAICPRACSTGGCTDAFPGNFCSLLVARSRCSGKLGCGCRKSCGFCGTTDTDSFPFLPDLGLPPLE
ncbi:uncharacterized protein LOC143465771 [Clavelina lepadiformis]|uniref:uncharacterized protein LOC143465771 n=1 Tax=Clavelina lepadiformis TaxID=159417 RepID=UPI0040421505